MHRYTKEQIDYIRSIAKGRSRKEVHRMTTERFNLDVSKRSIEGVMYNNKIYTTTRGKSGGSLATQFKKGQKAWNKDMKGLQLGGEEGWFKKGRESEKRLPVGSERVAYTGFVMIKISQPDVWALKHRWLWEKHHGEIPKDQNILFKDGNKLNVTIENLFMSYTATAPAVVLRGLPTNSELYEASHRLAELDIAIKKVTENENTL